jgi:hypothetical protein
MVSSKSTGIMCGSACWTRRGGVGQVRAGQLAEPREVSGTGRVVSGGCGHGRHPAVSRDVRASAWGWAGLAATVVLPDMVNIGSRTVLVAVLPVMPRKVLARGRAGAKGAAVTAGPAGGPALGQPQRCLLDGAPCGAETEVRIGHSRNLG